MHVLGHGMSHRRKTAKPKDLHIRKISFSGCSLSSGSSFSSSPSVSTVSSSPPSTASTARPWLESRRWSRPGSRPDSRPDSRPESGSDRVGRHPTYQPPPFLRDRPLLGSPERPQFDDEATTLFFADDDRLSSFSCSASSSSHPPTRPLDKELPRLPSGDDVTPHPAAEPLDYFSVPLLRRPHLPCSRWSESTIASVESESLDDDDDDDSHSDTDGRADSPDEDEGVDGDAHHRLQEPAIVGHDAGADGEDGADDDDHHFKQPPAGHRSMPNFSHKRATAVPKRPPIKTLDSLDEFIKRGGWKRRGIVFQNEDMAGGPNTDTGL